MVKRTKRIVTKIKDIGTCYECQHAYLMQSRKENPIVAECEINHERQVARMNECSISMFKRNNGEKIIHPMIKANNFI